ncbi:MAG: hypothetical protein O7G88_15295 [bacterium]|nr:hypothetical protein [bacterium]
MSRWLLGFVTYRELLRFLSDVTWDEEHIQHCGGLPPVGCPAGAGTGVHWC